MFGPHLIIDGSRCDTKKLADRILVEQVMNDYPAAIGMTKIGGPYMFEYQAPDPAYSGVSGIVVIAESHIAIHTFPELDYFTMDIFSCKNFDHELAIDYIRKAFDVKEMDRMLVQRGLSFRGPHHGKLGATDELIAAAEARLSAGVISKETAVPGEYGETIAAPAALSDGREAALERRTEKAEPAAGRMLWPQYGVTPDVGTYGEAGEECEECARPGATIIPLHADASATVPVQVNPTASISGLLDKMTATGGQGRALGRAVAQWEKLTRDEDAAIALALTTPVVAEGMRELLVYSVEHGYADVVVTSADDLFADLYEALGFAHYDADEGPAMTEEGRAATLAFFSGFLEGLGADAVATASDLWRKLGAHLPASAPRKGLLQAAAASDVPVFVTGLSTSAFGPALLAARSRGGALSLDPSEDVLSLARLLGRFPRLGVIRAGDGAADALLAHARETAALVGGQATTLVGSVTLGAARAFAEGEGHVAVKADASLTLPLVVTALAQRAPGYRRQAPRYVVEVSSQTAALA